MPSASYAIPQLEQAARSTQPRSLGDADQLAKFLKPVLPECLRQNVRELLLGRWRTDCPSSELVVTTWPLGRRRADAQATPPWHAANAPAMYSASHEDRATTRCFCDCQVTGLPSRKKMIPLVLFLPSRSSAMSLSE
ncbi:hypothetical protein U9M48_023355 [Paspalum notatum var. saurae]|uniref:Uncharacterized protein n=1 Tax=Paspalum notatum var. saurae TaxID=547442 RepID=A0AAQ3WUL9_PASNO